MDSYALALLSSGSFTKRSCNSHLIDHEGNFKKGIFFVSLSLLIAGTLLLINNTIGLYSYTSIDNNNLHLMFNGHRTISEKTFWESAQKKDKENPKEYVSRLSKLVSNYMLCIDPKYCKPTFFENWLLYLYSQEVSFWEWQDTEKHCD